jgi:hypothetical protein
VVADLQDNDLSDDAIMGVHSCSSVGVTCGNKLHYEWRGTPPGMSPYPEPYGPCGPSMGRHRLIK